MTRLARDRDTHLTREEIAVEALRCFDESDVAPSIRHLATVLHVTPSAIYHHFPSRAAIIQSAVDLVWDEAGVRFLELVPDPYAADPTEVLVTAGTVTRRVFGAHHQVAPFIAATPQSNGPLTAIVTLTADAFERIGLGGEAAAASFHAYASYTLGSVLFAATRRITNEQLLTGLPTERHPTDPTGPVDRPPNASAGDAAFRQALGEMIDISVVDFGRDEKLFADGLRQLVTGFGKDAGEPALS